MIKYKGVLPLGMKLGRDTPAANIRVIKHPDDQNVYISSEEEILLMF